MVFNVMGGNSKNILTSCFPSEKEVSFTSTYVCCWSSKELIHLNITFFPDSSTLSPIYYCLTYSLRSVYCVICFLLWVGLKLCKKKALCGQCTYYVLWDVYYGMCNWMCTMGCVLWDMKKVLPQYRGKCPLSVKMKKCIRR